MAQTDTGPNISPFLLVSWMLSLVTVPKTQNQLDEQWRVQRRGRRNPAGANMLMDMSTLKRCV